MAFHTDNYEIRWRNFRAFEDTGWIVLKPLTILIGPNNCGKSSIIAPLLMMNQTLLSPDSTSSLVTRGPVIDVGTYKDMIRDHLPNRELSLGFRFHLHKKPKGEIKEVGSYPPGGVELKFRQKHKAAGSKLVSYALEDVYRRPMLEQRLDPQGLYTISGVVDPKELQQHELATIQNSRPINFSFSPSAILNRFTAERDGEKKTPRKKADDAYSRHFSLYLNTIGFAHGELMNFFHSMTYIGPLRDRPKRVYEFSGAVPRSVGSRGQTMAHFLADHLDELGPKINRWIKEFEFGDGLTVKMLDEAQTICALFFEKNGEKEHTNVAHSGFGASQLLPLIIQAVAAPSENLVVAEQPEIHLNPRLQAKLGDLFVEMVKNDHRVIVETHSEHVLLSIRTKIAQGDIAASDVKLLFVEGNAASAKIREVRIEDDGSIQKDEWPKGFLAEGLQQVLQLSAAQAKRRGGRGVEGGHRN